MAYAEKLVKSWRACWYRPDGKVDKKSGFTTKKAARRYAEDQESAIRNHRWTDPRLGQQTVEDWAHTWYNALDLEPSTVDLYHTILEVHILPRWGNYTLLQMLNAELEIAAWERDLNKTKALSTATQIRGLLGTVLGDTVPHILPRNPAARRRGRGRIADRRNTGPEEKVWLTPVQALHLAERAALMSGRDAEFILIVALAYTGLRIGELFALEHSGLDNDRLAIRWQLHTTGDYSTIRKIPKDGSTRTLDLPPFLTALLKEQSRATRRSHTQQQELCDCIHSAAVLQLKTEDPEEYTRYVEAYGHPRGIHLFHGPDPHAHRSGLPTVTDIATRAGVDPRTVNYHLAGSRRLHPTTAARIDAAIGEVRYVARPCPNPAEHWSHSVFTDALFGPAATGRRRSGRGGAPARPVIVDLSLPPGIPQRTTSSAINLAPGCWLPIAPGLTPHSLRHTHKTWLDEDNVAQRLQDERMGHTDSSIQARYTHITPAMREHLSDALTRRWQRSLVEFAQIRDASPVAVFDALLAAQRGEAVPLHSRITPDPARRPLKRQRRRGA